MLLIYHVQNYHLKIKPEPRYNAALFFRFRTHLKSYISEGPLTFETFEEQLKQVSSTLLVAVLNSVKYFSFN